MIGQKTDEAIIKSFAKTNTDASLPVYSVVASAFLMYCRRMHLDFSFEDAGSDLVKINITGGIDPSDPVIGCLHGFFDDKIFSRALTFTWQKLSEKDEEEFISNYPTSIDVFFRTLSYYYGKKGSIEYIQPDRVTRVLSYFMRQHGVSSLYNPFAGLCSYPISMGEKCTFYAQEINLATLALAKIRLHAYGLDPRNVVLEDSILNWDDKGFDAIVASVPFGLQISSEYRRKYDLTARTVEDLFFERSLDDRNPLPKKMAATIVPDSFCYRSSSISFRKKMCDLGCLDTVIALPEGILPYTSVSATIIILSFESKKKEVRFVNAKGFLKDFDSKSRILDSKRIISVIENSDEQYVKVVPYSELYDQGCILNSDNYISSATSSKEGSEVRRLGDLITRVRLSRITHTEEMYYVPEEAFTNKVLDIVHPRTDSLERMEMGAGYIVTGPCILFLTKGRSLYTYLHLTNDTIAVEKRVYAFRVISNDISPQYIATVLIQDEVFRRQALQPSTHNYSHIIDYMLNRNLVVHDLAGQEAFLKEQEAKESAEINIQRAAEDARYQLNKAGSDIAHMLGTVFKKQKEIIREFQYIEPGTDKYQGNVISLIDTAQYVNRVITAVGKDLAKAKINLKSALISSEVEDYVRAWGNFNGSSDFSLIIQDLTNHDVAVKMDTLFFRILMDTLIDNAWRHGFEQGNYNAENGNMIAVRISPVLLEEKQFLLLSVMNNGRPLDEHYKVKDYIERGNFKGDSGRTGLGGNHVYTITKRHNGFFALSSEQDWSFVADILLPVNNPGNTLFNTEYDGEYV